MDVENWRIRQGMRSFNTDWGKEKDGGVIDWAGWAEQNDGSKARWVAHQQATRWFSRQNHEALGSTSNQEVGRKWGRGEVQKGDKAKAGGWLKERWVSLMPYNMYIPFLLSPPIPQCTLPTRTLSILSGWLRTQSSRRTEGLSKREELKTDEVKLHMFNGGILGHLPCPASRMLAVS